MSSRATLIAVFVALVVALLVAVALGTPWRPLPGPLSEADPSRNFTAAEIAREDAFHAAVRPPAYLSMVLALVLSLLLGLTPLGARLVGLLPGPWPLRVLLGGIVLTAVARLVVLPLDARAESVLRRCGLSARGWGSWLLDVVKSYGVGLVVTLLVLFGLYALVR